MRALLTTLGLLSLAGMAALAQAAGPLPPLTFDRIDDTARVWRLSDFVVTDGGPPPSSPSAVYIQFGFMGCAPCEVLARVANQELGDRAVRVYVHLDDVLLHDYDGNNQRLWMDLWTYAQNEPYNQFVSARRGSTDLMHQLCGAGTNAPTGLLIQPDGLVFRVLTDANEAQAQQAFRDFLAAQPAP